MRAKWKGPFFKEELLKSLFYKNKKIKSLKTMARDCVILPILIDKQILLHNGRFFLPLKIKPEMINHKLGEFIFTRFRHVYKKKNKMK